MRMTRAAHVVAWTTTVAAALTAGWRGVVWSRRARADRPVPCASAAEYRGTLGPGATRTLVLCPRRGARVSLRVDGRGAGDIDCYVYGPRRERVARDDDETNACALSWRAVDGGSHVVEIVN